MISPLELQSKIDRTVNYQGSEYLFFSGTAYLGMGNVPEFEKLIIGSITKYGISHGLSRINNIRLHAYHQFETFFAEKAGAEKSLVWSSGFLAGMAAVQFLSKHADHVFVAPDTHPAILPHGINTDPFLDHITWAESCIKKSEELPNSKILILANAVDPLIPTVHQFDWIKNLPDRHDYTLLIDDSHAFGVLGKGIYGTYSQWKHLPVRLLVSGSLNKGLSLPAGILLGDAATIDEIAGTNIFRSSSPPAPGYLQAFLQAEYLYQSQQQKLKENIRLFQNLTNSLNVFNFVEGYPIFSFPDQSWSEKLFQSGIIVSSFPYPNPFDPLANRIVVSATHHPEDLIQLHKVISGL
ncbi:aminotransferase class I/II-fold pyridoxal phosphate-dependent enzyme [Aquiflexum lacus]|uniref:aminotransferase class I/II-fold pyridoxal phosphate-dependent enzyme n=1 Tax=Aquiflexum lacus TaxID=2483805 RepID=UPI001E5DEFC9|nr:aminotransferase class I/II-fold pyridoxal phosphate-dependent enzyme [Aquiflexum lacus]